MLNNASEFNNVGICAAGLMGVLGISKTLPISKSLLVMPLIMHEGTVRFLSDGRTAERKIAALVAMRPELFSNFSARFIDSLSTSINAIQFLIHADFIKLDSELKLVRNLEVDSSFGRRAVKINLAAKNISSVLASPADELYLNLRIPL
jgi:hypothetical protein